MVNEGLNLSEKVYKTIKYWKQYKDERIVIIDQFQNYDYSDDNLNIIMYLTEGTVDSILTTSPGFKLTDVVERILVKRINILRDGKEVVDHYEPVSQEMKIRETEKKHIYFSAIDQIELKEDFEDGEFVFEME